MAMHGPARPRYTQPPGALAAKDHGLEVDLDPEQPCGLCGRFLSVAKVVRLKEGRYDYACLGCAVRT